MKASADPPASAPPVTPSIWSQYLKTKSPQAFEQVIRRHLDFVYAAAHRQVRDAHLAQDVTQAVFIVLTRRAETLKNESSLAGWLFKTTRYCAANAVKAEQRRRRHERAAAAQRPEVVMSSDPSAQSPETGPLLPLLDDAIASLGQSDRQAILLRYLQGLDMPDLSHALGISDTAARKRVGRAVERLRRAFARRGVNVASTVVGTTLTTAAAQAAPPGAAAAVSTAVAGAASPAAAIIAHQFFHMIAWANAKIFAALAAMLLLMVATTTVVVLHSTNSKTPPLSSNTLAAAPAPATPRILTLNIIDKQTRQRLPNTPVVVLFDKRQTTLGTDTSGNLAISLPIPQPNIVRMKVARPGYSPVILSWRSDTALDALPPAYTLALEKGTSIGGIVRDKAGNPIVGASVFLIITKVSPDPHERSDIFNVEVRTDDLGRWRYDLAPQKLASVSIRLSHPGYVSDKHFDSTASDENPDVYRNFDYTLVMHKGMAVLGRVTDEAGNPIAGAWVKQGDVRRGTSFPDTKTNFQGDFNFDQADPGPMTLTVQAPGFAPALKQIDVTDDLGSVQFKLSPGNLVRGRVMDPRGRPIPDVDVAVNTWLRKHSLDWKVKTDDQGRFEWHDAPPGTVTYSFSKFGYMDNRTTELTPGDAEQTITLRLPLLVKGSVVDAKTDRPVANFHVIPGRQFGKNDSSIYWDRQDTGKFSGGEYEFRFTDLFAIANLRVEADGYAPSISRAIHPDEGIDAPIQIDFNLQPVTNIRAIVLAPDGTPAVGAKAALAIPKEGFLSISDGQLRPNTDSVTAGDDGAISFPPRDADAVVVVVSHAGYATVLFSELRKQANNPIKLLPWSKIDAMFKVGSKPFTDEPVCALSQPPLELPEASVNFEAHAITDAMGRAVFDKIPAGSGYLTDWRMRSNSEWGGVIRTDYTVSLGETLHIQAGGTGRPVIGRAVAPAGYQAKLDWLQDGTGYLNEIPPQHPDAPPYPANWANMSFDARRAWWQGPEVKQFQAGWIAHLTQRQSAPGAMYFALFERDGQFHINDVPPGEYMLNIQLNTPWNDPVNGGRPLLIAHKNVQIAPIPGGRTDQPLDIGALTLNPPEVFNKPRPEPTSAPASPPEPGSPADVDMRYQTALRNGDAEAALACVDISHPWVEPFVRARARYATAGNRAIAAATAALGEDGEKNLAKLLRGLLQNQPIFNYSWQITGDSAVPTGPSAQFIGRTMVRLDGQWKFNEGEIFIKHPNLDPAKMEQMTTKQIARLDALTDALKTGKVKTPEQAAAMMQSP